MSIVRQCELLSVHRSGFYYRSREESALNLELMYEMDAHYMEHPEKGAKRVYTWLKHVIVNIKGHQVNRLHELLPYNIEPGSCIGKSTADLNSCKPVVALNFLNSP